MRGQTGKEMLEIALPFAIIGAAFAVLLGGFYQSTASVGAAYIPYKIASMVVHSLTGSEECLAVERNGLVHKGWLSQDKIDEFESDYPSSMPNCVKMPCWRFKAIIRKYKDSGGDKYEFGYNPDDSNFWSGNVRTQKIPVLIDDGTNRYLGRLTVSVKPMDRETCNEDLQALGGSP